ncbi:MAG: LysM peptidoglycan-binding domain-containing protein [Pseudomonadota bacterium]
MAAIVAGNSLGLSLTSLSTLGQNGSEGASTAGRNGERVYVNAVTGNLVVQGQDEFVASRGSDLSVVRTYNGRGRFTAGVQDAWAVGSTRQKIVGPQQGGTGTLTRVDHDGAEATYTWDAARALYVTTAGGGAHDTVGWDSAQSQYVWRDGTTGLVERYDQAGKLVRTMDADSNTVTYAYNAQGQLEKMTAANGEVLAYKYNATGDVSEITTGLAGSTTSTTRTSYSYDAIGNLQEQTEYARAVSGATATNQPAGVSDTADRTTAYSYDKLNRKKSETRKSVEYTDPDTFLPGVGAITTRYEYDALGNTVQQIAADNGITYTYYDALGRVTAIAQPARAGEDGSTALTPLTVYSRDAFGNVVMQTEHARGASSTAGAQPVAIVDAANDRTSFTYLDAAGHVTHTQDAQGNHRYASFDAYGRVAKEWQTVAGSGVIFRAYQYDSIGNLRWVGDTHSQVLMNYDLAGNRMSVFTHVINTDGLTETPNDTNRYFQYDKMNRQTVVDAIDAAGNINANQGHKLTYDLNGNRTSDTFFGKVVNKVYKNGDPEQFDYKASTALGQLTETYKYDSLNRLTSIQRSDGHLFGQVDGEPDPQIDARKYDLASRVTQTGGQDWLPANYLKELYGRDANGNAISGNGSRRRETYYNADGQQVVQVVKHNGGGVDYRQISDTFDGAGNLTAYRVLNSATNNYGVVMRALDGYREASVSGTSTAFEPGTSTSNYDANGHLRSVTQPGQVDRTYVNDINGQVLATVHGTKLMRQLIVNGEVLGQYGSGLDGATPRSATGEVVYDNNIAEFQLGYRSITPTYPLAAPGAYVVRSGETLRSIAQQAYGDSRRWFQIADANGIQGDSDLRVGLTLNLPNVVGGAHNGAADFQPYDPSRMVGDTTPYMAPKPEDENVFGELLMIVVAIAMSVMVPGMAGAILGSLASQTVGIASGVQDFYDLKQVAMAGLSAGVSMGMASVLPANSWLAGNGWGPAAARAAMASTITQGVATAVGWQKTISWKGIVAAAGGAAVGNVVGNALGKAWGGSAGGNFAADVATRLAASGTAAVLRGGKVQVAQVVVDAFGNAVGESMLEQMNSAGEQEDALGAFIDSNEQRRDRQDSLASRHNANVMAGAFASGTDLSPTHHTLRRLGMFNFDAGNLAAVDRDALSKLSQLGLSEGAAFGVAPRIASVTELTGMAVEETFLFGGATLFPRAAWTASDFASLGRWAGMPTQRAAFESALLQTGSAKEATNIAVLSAVRERLVDQLPRQIEAAQGADRAYLARMHSAMVNGLLSTDVYFPVSIPEILPRGYRRMNLADLPVSLQRRTFEDPTSGYFGALYRNVENDSFIYANRGTEGPDKLDVRANILQAFAFESAQYTKAMEIARDLRTVFGNQLSFTGHSLGGGLASAQALVTGLPAATFNAAGLNPETIRRVLGSGFENAWARGSSLVSAYYVIGDPLNQIQDGRWLVAGTAARGRHIASGMASDPGLGFSTFNWSDKNLMLPLVNGEMQSGRVGSVEANALPRAIGTRYALPPTAAPGWLSKQLGGVNPVPTGAALHSMTTSMMYALFGSIVKR